MVKMCVINYESPYGREKPYTALRFALTAIVDGHDVTMVLLQDGIFVAKKAQNPAEYPNHLEYLENAISEGLKVIVCGVCCQARGVIQEDLAEGCKIVGMHEIVEAVAYNEKTITF